MEVVLFSTFRKIFPGLLMLTIGANRRLLLVQVILSFHPGKCIRLWAQVGPSACGRGRPDIKNNWIRLQRILGNNVNHREKLKTAPYLSPTPISDNGRKVDIFLSQTSPNTTLFRMTDTRKHVPLALLRDSLMRFTAINWPCRRACRPPSGPSCTWWPPPWGCRRGTGRALRGYRSDLQDLFTVSLWKYAKKQLCKFYTRIFTKSSPISSWISKCMYLYFTHCIAEQPCI